MTEWSYGTEPTPYKTTVTSMHDVIQTVVEESMKNTDQAMWDALKYHGHTDKNTAYIRDNGYVRQFDDYPVPEGLLKDLPPAALVNTNQTCTLYQYFVDNWCILEEYMVLLGTQQGKIVLFQRFNRTLPRGKKHD